MEGASSQSSPKAEHSRSPKPNGDDAQILPPQTDGGFACWVQVLGSFALWMNTWGIINTYGAFQTTYETMLPQSPSQIAWIGSIQTFLLFFVGILSAPLMDVGRCRPLLVAGNFLVVFGLMMTSICTKYWQLVISQGIVVGLGFGILFLPSVAILAQYFVSKRALAIGTAATASGIGGVVYPIMLHRLIPNIGFGWSVRIMAFLALIFGLISVAIVRSRGSRPPKPVDAASAFLRNLPLLAFTLAYFLIFVAIYVPVVYIQSFSLSTGAVDQQLAFYLLPILMSSSAVGRFVLGYVADKVGVLNLAFLMTAAASVLCAGWIGAANPAGVIIFALLYGVALGSVVSLPSPGVAQLTTSDMFNSHLGMSSLVASFGVLIGTPIAGALLRTSLEFKALQAFSAIVLAAATAFIGLARVSKVGWSISKV